MTDETLKIDELEKELESTLGRKPTAEEVQRVRNVIDQGGIVNVLDKILNRLEVISDNLETTNKRLEAFENANNAQLEAIRSGLVANHSEFSRLTAKVLNMSADLNDLTEEIRKDKLALK